jgi:hypothetical protein
VESKPILDNVDKMLGFVPNLHRLMSISPNALSRLGYPDGIACIALRRHRDTRTK